MKLLSFVAGGQRRYGAMSGEGIVDLGARHPEAPDLRAALRLGMTAQLAATAAAAAPDFGPGDIAYLPTIPNPEKIICIGVNYVNRHEEYRDGSAPPKYPSVFMRARDSLVGHLCPIMKPPESDELDYEGEIALVIGREGRRIPPERAHEYIAGLSVMNEGSVRDYLRHARFNVTQGKNFESSGALGPWLVTADEVDPMGELRVMTFVNGEERQNDTTASLVFPFRALIAYLSVFYRLRPGDVIATGTPNGAGARFDPPRYLRAGDVVEVEVPRVGRLCNPVVGEAA